MNALDEFGGTLTNFEVLLIHSCWSGRNSCGSYILHRGSAVASLGPVAMELTGEPGCLSSCPQRQLAAGAWVGGAGHVAACLTKLAKSALAWELT